MVYIIQYNMKIHVVCTYRYTYILNIHVLQTYILYIHMWHEASHSHLNWWMYSSRLHLCSHPFDRNKVPVFCLCSFSFAGVFCSTCLHMKLHTWSFTYVIYYTCSRVQKPCSLWTRTNWSVHTQWQLEDTSC